MSYTKNKKQVVEKYPEKCQVNGCDESTDVAFVKAYAPSGELHIFQPSTVLDSSSSGQWNAAVRSGYEFRGWIARCGGCYMREIRERL